jgi:transcriptional regulator with XRE-family HTH domain
MDNLSKFGERLKEYMIESGNNATSLAKIVNTNRTSMSEYVRGLHLPDTQIFYALIEYFNCSADYLLGLSDYPLYTTFKPIPSFGERFRYVLEFCDYSQYRLEKELKISGSIVYNWLFAKTLPSVDNLIKIAKHLECAVDFLIGRVD